MANLKRYGFIWAGSLQGASTPTVLRLPVATAYQYTVNGGNNCDINIGDPVRLLNTGYLEIADGSEGASGGETIFGIVASVEPYWDGLDMRPSSKLPGGTAYGTNLTRQSYLNVIPVAGQIFLTQADDASTATTEAAYLALVGEFCDHIHKDSGASRVDSQLDISTHGTINGQWTIIGIADRHKADFTAVNVDLLVTINEVQSGA